MSFLLSLPVYFLFFAILYRICKGDEAGKFYALALGTLLFPLVGTFISNPAIAPNHAFIYTYFIIEFLQSIGKKRSVALMGITIPLAFIVISTTATILHTDGLDPKTFYVAGRDFFETYGYLLAAYIAGSKIDDAENIYEKFYGPIIVLCVCAVIEVLIKYNIPYTIICSAYPNYDMGYTSLESGGVFTDSWRIRAAVTTVHPTALGTLLSSLFAFYIPLWKKDIIPQRRLIAVLASLLIAVFISGSRTAMICTILTTFFFLFAKSRLIIKIAFIGLTIFSLGTILALFVTQFENSRGSNLDLRREQLIFSALAIQQSPIYGNGVQYTSKYIFGDTDDGSRGTARGYNNENLGGLESIIFRKIIDYGFLGCTFFFVFLIYMQLYFIINRKKSLYACTGSYVVLSFTIFLILSGTLANSIVYGFTLIGFCLAKTRKDKILYYETKKINDESAQQVSNNK